jgi:hypothetical protein
VRGDMLFTKHRLCSINYMQGVRISAAFGQAESNALRRGSTYTLCVLCCVCRSGELCEIEDCV